jgi:hypothetical protein
MWFRPDLGKKKNRETLSEKSQKSLILRILAWVTPVVVVLAAGAFFVFWVCNEGSGKPDCWAQASTGPESSEVSFADGKRLKRSYRMGVDRRFFGEGFVATIAITLMSQPEGKIPPDFRLKVGMDGKSLKSDGPLELKADPEGNLYFDRMVEVQEGQLRCEGEMCFLEFSLEARPSAPLPNVPFMFTVNASAFRDPCTGTDFRVTLKETR